MPQHDMYSTCDAWTAQQQWHPQGQLVHLAFSQHLKCVSQETIVDSLMRPAEACYWEAYDLLQYEQLHAEHNQVPYPA